MRVGITFGTFDLLHGDPKHFASLVRRGKVLQPEPGETLTI